MAMTVSCPSCQKTLRIGEENQGKKMRCPSCQQVFKAPTLEPPKEEARDEPPPRDDNPFSGLDDRPSAPSRRSPERDPDDRPPRDDYEDDDRPSRRSSRDDDDRPSRRSSRDDDDDRPSRRSSRDEDEDDRPSQRSSSDEYSDAPSRRSARDDDDDDRRSRRSLRDEDDYDDRRSRRSRDDDDDRGRRRSRRGGRPRLEEGGNAPKILGIVSLVLCPPCCYGFPGAIGFILGLIGLILAIVELNNLPDTPYAADKRKNLVLGRNLCIAGMCLPVVLFILLCGLSFVLNVGMRV
jgi:hypothetical protein